MLVCGARPQGADLSGAHTFGFAMFVSLSLGLMFPSFVGLVVLAVWRGTTHGGGSNPRWAGRERDAQVSALGDVVPAAGSPSYNAAVTPMAPPAKSA